MACQVGSVHARYVHMVHICTYMYLHVRPVPTQARGPCVQQSRVCDAGLATNLLVGPPTTAPPPTHPQGHKQKCSVPAVDTHTHTKIIIITAQTFASHVHSIYRSWVTVRPCTTVREMYNQLTQQPPAPMLQPRPLIRTRHIQHSDARII
jgi:hypothetical protein